VSVGFAKINLIDGTYMSRFAPKVVRCSAGVPVE
jgi:hypothetical protein